MILHTGLRTDIPAFFSDWLLQRLREGYVLVRNPYKPHALTRYRLSPDVVDLISFCTKDPRPMLGHLEEMKGYGQFWFVTVTPYGRDIEPNVPDKEEILQAVRELSRRIGKECVAWRYDPILLTDRYTEDVHIEEFSRMARALRGYTDVCVISFVDLYQKVKRNYPQCREVPEEARIRLGKEMVRIAHENGMTLKTCAEGDLLAQCGADTRGCMTVETYERALGAHLRVPARSSGRRECACYLGADIGAYDTCGHMCLYCYANSNAENVRRNRAAYDPLSPILCGSVLPGDVIGDAKQETWLDRQMRLDI